MKKLMKKVVAGILAGVMMMTSAVSVGAESEIYSAEDSTVFSDSGVKNKIQEYIENVMPHYLLSLEHYGSFRMTDLIPVYNWDGQDIEKYLIVVADNTKMIGTACVEYNNGEILSSFREENITLLYSLLIDNSPFQLGYSNDCFIIFANKQFSVIDNPENTNLDFINDIILDKDTCQSFGFNRTVYSAAQKRMVAYYASPIKNVANATDPNPEGTGLCWAACVACMGMHKDPSKTYTANDIYDLCNASTITDRPSGLPLGNNSWITFALEHIVSIENTKTSALSATKIASLLSKNKPIMVSVKKSSSSSTGHTLVLYYYYEIDSKTAQYVFMDPGNNSETVGRLAVTVDSTVMSDGSKLSFTSRNTNTYSYWSRSYYES